jgi:hypothetical protein
MVPTCLVGSGEFTSTYCPGIDWKEEQRLIEKTGTNDKNNKRISSSFLPPLSFPLVSAQDSVEYCFCTS